MNQAAGSHAIPFHDSALQFECEGTALVGILSLPDGPAAATRGVLIVVGGPQYRAGSHRQFTLLARCLAGHGIPTLRFDYRGMGDSDGPLRDFEHTAADLRRAVDCLMQAVPSLREVVVWGLCDGASAAVLHLAGDARVTGMVLLNPWVRTEAGLARATLRHYYVDRLMQGDFWRKLIHGDIDYRGALRSFGRLLAASRAVGAGKTKPVSGSASTTAAVGAGHPLPPRLLAGLQRFQGRILFVISGKDLTAQEFTDMAAASKTWRRLLAQPRVSRRVLAEADHTFSRAAWRDEVADITGSWVHSW
jgi:exosortase A-associated hydrolase 1